MICVKNNLKNDFKPSEFTFGESITKSAFSEIIEVVNVNSQKCYSIKLINYDPTQKQQEFSDGMKEELEDLEKISCITPYPDAIPKYFGYFSLNNESYSLVFEYLPSSLRNLINAKIFDKSQFDVKKIISIYKTLVDGLAFLQSIDMRAIDINPMNLMFDERNTLKIIDFDRSKGFVDSEKFNKELDSNLSEKNSYSSPEILQKVNFYMKISLLIKFIVNNDFFNFFIILIFYSSYNIIIYDFK